MWVGLSSGASCLVTVYPLCIKMDILQEYIDVWVMQEVTGFPPLAQVRVNLPLCGYGCPQIVLSTDYEEKEY